METALQQARYLSSGTLATLTGERRHDALDQVRGSFIEFVEAAGETYSRWQDAWLAFWGVHQSGSGQAWPRPVLVALSASEEAA